MGWLEGEKEVVLSIGNQQITGKNCIVKSFNVDMGTRDFETVSLAGTLMPVSKPIGNTTITLELVCLDPNLLFETWDEDHKPKIRDKKVEDCSIQELLFAIRKKVKG